ncbi:MAG: SDR family NAD(P)-dependent oxidoreductase [Pseudomonadales bacterium]
MDFGLSGKVAIVTGCASPKGIGNAIARALSEEGVKLLVTDVLADGIEQLARDLCSDGYDAVAVAGDQRVADDVQAVVLAAVEQFGSVDLLINAAALTNNLGSIANMSPEKWRNEIDVSLTGPYMWIRESAPYMKKNQWGRILNISSTNSLYGQKGVPAYVAAKGGLNALTKQAAREYAHCGITCNSLVLGVVATGIYEDNGFDPEVLRDMISRVPVGRMGLPDEIGAMAVFACSEQAAFMTGELITIDGGLSVSA